MSIVNGVKARRKDFGALIRIGFGAVFTLFFVNFIRTTDNNSNRILGIILIVPCALILIGGIKTRLRLKKVYVIGSAVSSLKGSEIKLSTLAEALGMKEKSLKKLLSYFWKKKIIQNCELYTEGEAKLNLLISAESSEVEIECPSCGKVFTAAAGSTARCPECASIINM